VARCHRDPPSQGSLLLPACLSCMLLPACLSCMLLPACLPACLCARDDRTIIPVTAPFAFGERGHIDITLRDITLFRRHDQVCVHLAGVCRRVHGHIQGTAVA
jgi:hypothetical protein